VLGAGTACGIALALCALLGWRSRLCFAGSVVLYLGYAAACRSFLAFQWDNLLLECGFLAVFLPARRASPAVHLLFRVVLFKLYFESGIAKWQSHLSDWHDGSAMTFYYETAPLPTWLAWHAHNLPAAWHHFESRATLFLELVIPFGIFGPRRARIVACAALTGFQILNVATANYGFFCYLAVALHLFLLDDADVARARGWLGPGLGTGNAADPGVTAGEVPPRWRWRRGLSFAAVAGFIAVSVAEGCLYFTEGGAWVRVLEPFRRVYAPLRLVNTYHLFSAITRERLEPEVQVQVPGSADPGEWLAQDLEHKPGAVGRAPGFVAPHQPRVDFLLWFHGITHARGLPPYAAALLERVCRAPTAVAGLFARPLPARITAVRMAYFRYQFTAPSGRRATGDYWRRSMVGATRPLDCDP
jgi:hypothetical protein